MTYPAGLDIDVVLFPFRLRAAGAEVAAGGADTSGAGSETFCRLDRRLDAVESLCDGCSGVLFSVAMGFLFRDTTVCLDWVVLLPAAGGAEGPVGA